jgi:hypothetical protein
MDGPAGSGLWKHETAAGRHDHELRARVVTWPPLRLARLRCERGSVDVVQARCSRRRDGGVMAIIGMDIHRSFAQAAFLQDGQVKRSNGSISFTTASSGSGSRSRSRTRLSSRPPATAPPSSGSCDLSSSAWSWRIREWFGRSPMPGLRRTRSTRSYWQDFTLAAFYRRSGLRTTTPNASGGR